MTLYNLIGIGLTAVILVVGVILKLRSKKKVDNLDSFCGIVEKGNKDIDKKPK